MRSTAKHSRRTRSAGPCEWARTCRRTNASATRGSSGPPRAVVRRLSTIGGWLLRRSSACAWKGRGSGVSNRRSAPAWPLKDRTTSTTTSASARKRPQDIVGTMTITASIVRITQTIATEDKMSKADGSSGCSSTRGCCCRGSRRKERAAIRSKTSGHVRDRVVSAPLWVLSPGSGPTVETSQRSV
jgi:hypothetical protein